MLCGRSPRKDSEARVSFVDRAETPREAKLHSAGPMSQIELEEVQQNRFGLLPVCPSVRR